MWDSPALPLVLELEQQGFRLTLTTGGELRIVPGSKLTQEQRRRLEQHGEDVAGLVRSCDPGVHARREVFTQQIAAAPDVILPRLTFTPDVPYTVSVCFSCGDANGRKTFGRCWRCSLAMRLALGWPIPVALVAALDSAKIA